MNTAISQAADTTKEAAEKLSNTFTPTYWVVLAAGLAHCGFVFGLLFDSEIILEMDALIEESLMLTIRAMSDGKGYSSRHLEHSDYYC